MDELFTMSPLLDELRQTVRVFVQRRVEPHAARADEDERFDAQLFSALGRELGLFGLTLPSSLGGAGLEPIATLLAIEEISRSDPALGLSYLAQEVLYVHNVFCNAEQTQGQRLLAPVLSGDCVAAMAMSEPEAGTDVFAMQTRARRDGDAYVLDGVKQWTTNGPVAERILVYAKSGDAARQISAFVVERERGGVSNGRIERKMGMRASPTSQLVFQDCRVPLDNRVGEEHGALPGMLANLEFERLALAAQSLGIALRCIDEMSRYAIRERQAFGRFLVEFGQIQKMLSEAVAQTAAARALLYRVAEGLGSRASGMGADAVKLSAGWVGERVSRDAIQVFGGYGYSREYPLERLHRDAILLSIGGGTNEAMQKNLARGLQRKWSRD
ncbi:MAG: acyl-CoA dehydrogenase family protein [Myxococcota bacterium]|nr:acyl-CoA dehydrogenase family protein [Myxococcota bacterium]